MRWVQAIEQYSQNDICVHMVVLLTHPVEIVLYK